MGCGAGKPVRSGGKCKAHLSAEPIAGPRMLRTTINFIDQRLGIAATSAPDQALLRERFVALKRQLPWLYGILFANLLGLYLSMPTPASVTQGPTAVFLTVLAVRMLYWLRMRGRPEQEVDIAAEMRKTYLIALLFCLGFCAWSIVVMSDAKSHHSIDIVMFGSLAAIGSCYALASFPAAAKVPLLLVTVPLAVVLALDNEASHAGIGASLIILTLLTQRLLDVQDIAFRRLVSSRFVIEAEKKRAIEAERIAIEEQSRVGRIANTDVLTGLANRRGFMAFLEQLSGAEWGQGLILFDLDGFKPINDTFGHPTGDAMLVEVSRRLQLIDGGGFVARLGGDEFAMLCDCTSASEAMAIASDAVDAIATPFLIGGRKMVISASAGVSFQTADDLTDAMLRADVALYSAKRSGRGEVALFSNAMKQDFQRRTSIEQALREPGLADTIELAFQPILDLERMELRSFEALARWRHSELGWIPPSEFIPITEQISMLGELSNALLRRAARAALEWPPHVRLSFNLSAVQLCTRGSASQVLSIIDEEGFDSSRLQIEVTETALMADFEFARENLSQLRAKGVRIVLDDFGAGYSSITYLREMDFEAVKLDGSLISSIGADGSGLPLLRGVLALCKAMGQHCVAEHIETARELDLLRRLGCRYGQGYFLSEPVDAEAAATMAWSEPEGERRYGTA